MSMLTAAACTRYISAGWIVTPVVVRESAAEVGAEEQTETAIGHEAGRKAALHEAQVSRGRQPFEADRYLELAGGNHSPRLQARGDERIENDGAPAGEIAHETKVVDLV